MITAMTAEIVLRRQYIQEKVNTIYFGGGTPSLLEKTELVKLLKVIYTEFDVSAEAEVTLEVNPDDINETNLELWKSSGINRLSIGIQSFHNETLKFINRVHTAQQSVYSIDLAKKYFNNINIDLIYAIPGEDNIQWEKNLDKALVFKPQHISAYNLTIEENTVFGNWLRKGKISEADEGHAAEQYQILITKLQSAGYEHYEVSNFCLPGKYSKHNTSYWQRKEYLGIGPGAHSYNFDSRQYNIASNPKYIKAINLGESPAEIEILSIDEKINEYLITGLRTKWGIDLDFLKNDLKYEIKDQTFLKYLFDNSLALMDQNNLILTEEGFLLADAIAIKLSV